MNVNEMILAIEETRKNAERKAKEARKVEEEAREARRKAEAEAEKAEKALNALCDIYSKKVKYALKGAYIVNIEKISEDIED